MFARRFSFLSFIYTTFPFLRWLSDYNFVYLRKDINAGLTVSLVLMPQSMANAQLAGLPAYHGLYAALLPPMVGALWGSSRQMVTSTGAVLCLMASAALQPLVIDSPAGYVAHMALLTLFVGLIQLALGALRLGMVVNFLSLPVVRGFTNAAAIIIATSQLAKLFGINIDSGNGLLQDLLATFSSAWNYTHFPSLFMAALTVAILVGLPRVLPKAPAVLVAVVITTLLSWGIGFEQVSTVAVTQIAGDEPRILLMRLAKQEQEMANLQKEVAQLEREELTNPVAALEKQYKKAEKQLLLNHVERNMKLVREHLRRILFVAETKTDGNKVFYVKSSPHLVMVQPVISTATQQNISMLPQSATSTQQVGEVGASNGTIKASINNTNSTNSTVMVKESPSPAQPFADGKTWRLRIGNKAPQLDKLQFFSGGAVVGTIDSGLPVMSVPHMSLASLLTLFPAAFAIAFVGFAESISIGRAAASVKGCRLNANQEIVGQGLANVVGGLTLSSPVSGSFSSSAVNLANNAQTGLSSVFAGCVTLIVLLFFTGALAHLPQPVLAVVVIKAAIGLFQIKYFVNTWRVQWVDGVIAVITFIATLAFSPELDKALVVGVVISLAVFFYKTMNPKISILSVADDGMLRDAELFQLEQCKHIAIIQFQGPLFFGNANVLENTILDKIEFDKDLRHIHLVCSGITSLDASGEDTLDTLVQRAYTKKIGISFSGVVGSVSEMLARSGFIDLLGDEEVYVSPREAICQIQKKIQHDANCAGCPLANLFCRAEAEKTKSEQPETVKSAVETTVEGTIVMSAKIIGEGTKEPLQEAIGATLKQPTSGQMEKMGKQVTGEGEQTISEQILFEKKEFEQETFSVTDNEKPQNE